jgi:wobble nucleotide-excising tRNase
VKAEIEIQT